MHVIVGNVQAVPARYDAFTEEILTHVSAMEIGGIVSMGDL